MKSMLSRISVAALLSAGLLLPAAAEQAKGRAAKQEQAKDTASAKDDNAKAKKVTPAQQAARNRMKECGAEWQALKKQGKDKDTTWRKFSSQCLKNKKS